MSRQSTFFAKATVSLFIVVSLVGCKSTEPRRHWWEVWKPKPVGRTIVPDTEAYAAPPNPVYSESGGASDPFVQDEMVGETYGAVPLSEPIRSDDPAGMITALQTVYFEFDSDRLNNTEKQVLDRNVQWLRQNPDVVVQIEGHCDERGTPEYNLNLGQRRADKVREYLGLQGIDPSRLITISYGEERPADPGATEQAYALNRRVQFMVY